jgi:hypothetical protein
LYLSKAHIDSLNELIAKRPGEIIFRPSGISRVSKCPGSVRLSRQVQPQRIPTQSQAEGTAAHTVAQEALQGIRQPEEWLGRIIDVDGVRIEVTEEMAEGASLHVSTVKEYAKGGAYAVEYRLSLEKLDPTNPVLKQNAGTTDGLILDYENRELTIVDLKFGKGVMVPANAPQLLNYAGMALVSLPQPEGGWRKIRTVVVQPRSSNPQEYVKVHETNPFEIMEFLGNLYRDFLRALEPEQVLQAGDHCEWCPAKGICPLLRQEAFSVTQTALMAKPLVTNLSPAPKMAEKAEVLPEINRLTPQEVGTILTRRNLYDFFLGEVEKRAVNMLSMGIKVPGYKLVSRSGHRKWKDKREVIIANLTALGLKPEQCVSEPKLVTPRQAEMLLPTQARGGINAWTEKPELSPVLVSETDARPAISPPATVNLVNQ